jgi:hypothetical protein
MIADIPDVSGFFGSGPKPDHCSEAQSSSPAAHLARRASQ